MSAAPDSLRARLLRAFEPARSAAPAVTRRSRDSLILVGATVVAAALVLWEGRGTTYLSDEQIILWSTVNLDPATLAGPHHGSLMATTRAVFYAVTTAFGADAYWLLRMIGYAGVLISGVLVYVIARRRVGSTLALIPAILLLFLGTSWDVLLVPLNGIFWAWAVAAGLAAFVALERGDLKGDLAAVVLLLISVVSGSIGTAFVAGAAVYVLLGADRIRRLWVFAVPMLAYVVWFLWARKFHQTPVQSENSLLVPAYAVDSFGNAWAAILGLNVAVGDHAELGIAPAFDYGWGPLLAAIAAAGLGLRLWLGSVPRSLWAFLAALAAFWGLSALTTSTPELRTPEASRYVFGVVALVLLMSVDAVRGLRPRTGVVVAAFVALAVALSANVFHLVDARSYLSEESREMRAQLQMLELAGLNGDLGYVPGLQSPEVSPLQLIISSGAYLQTVDRVGSWAYSVDEVLEQEDTTRQNADAVLIRALQLELTADSATRPSQACERVEPSNQGVVEATLPAGGARLSTEVDTGRVQLRRFADTFAVTLGAIVAETPTVLEIPEDSAPRDWMVSIASSTPVEICPLGEAAATSQ